MIAFRSLILCTAAALALAACSKEATFSEPIPDYAAIHWVNAVPDTGQQDIRVVDRPSNAALFDANFRGFNMFYQPIESGTRTVRIFNSSGDPAIASQVLQEVTLNLAADSGYTVIHAGFARTGGVPARTVLVISDQPTNEDTGHVAIRAINAGAGLGPVDVWIRKRPVSATTADSLPDTPDAANVAFGATTPYISVLRDGATADTIRVVFATTGTKTVLASVLAPTGVAGSATVNPIAGARVGGSVLSAVLVPRSVAGSAATNFTTPSTLYLVDKRPPNTAP